MVSKETVNVKLNLPSQVKDLAREKNTRGSLPSEFGFQSKNSMKYMAAKVSIFYSTAQVFPA
jgi:hypothetical protein